MNALLRNSILRLAAAIGLACAARWSSAATIGLNFTGTTKSFSGGFVPDVMGAVGPNHIVETLNLSIAVYDKATGALLRREAADSFWRAALPRGGGGSVVGTFDPCVVYDPTSSRWFVTYADGGGNQTSHNLLSISDTASPVFGQLNSLLNGWKGYSQTLAPLHSRVSFQRLLSIAHSAARCLNEQDLRQRRILPGYCPADSDDRRHNSVNPPSAVPFGRHDVFILILSYRAVSRHP
jgi:hypothetical protein